MWQDDQKYGAFKTAKRIVKVNQNIIEEQCIRKGHSVLAVSYHEKLVNKEFAWDRNNLSHADTVSSIPHLIDKDMVRKPISKMKNGNVAGPSGVRNGKSSRRSRS